MEQNDWAKISDEELVKEFFGRIKAGRFELEIQHDEKLQIKNLVVMYREDVSHDEK